MSFREAIMSYYLNCFDFNGRASRSEYWWIVPYQILFITVAMLVSSVIEILYFLFLFIFLFSIIPNTSVTIRRLHDTNKPWYLIFLTLIPYIGGLILVFFLTQESTPGKNRYGFPHSDTTSLNFKFSNANVFNSSNLTGLYKDVTQQKDNPQKQTFSETEQNHNDK